MRWKASKWSGRQWSKITELQCFLGYNSMGEGARVQDTKLYMATDTHELRKKFRRKNTKP